MWRTYETSITRKEGRHTVVCGGYREAQCYSPVSKECLKAVEEITGRKTDGWKWITADEEEADNKLLEEVPLDGSYRKMKRTELITRTFANGCRVVYEHLPTGRLFYLEHGDWRGTYPSYCYNTKTGERGANY